jgi:hypothetical protein
MQGRVTGSALRCARRLTNHTLVLGLGTFLLSPTPASAGGGHAAGSPPAITAAKLSSSLFRVSGLATAISADLTPRGSAFEFSLSQAAALQIVITHPALGLSQGGRCLQPSAELRRANARSCARMLTMGTFTRASEAAGADSLAFSGRIGRRALAPGVYRAVLQARNGNGVSTPVTLTLAVVR